MDVQKLYRLCQPLAREAYQPGNRNTFMADNDTGFLVEQDGYLIVAIAGSDDFSDWDPRKSGNLNISTTQFLPGIYLHAGVLEAAQKIANLIRNEVWDNMEAQIAKDSTVRPLVIFTGHSRGGAIAQLLPLVMGMSPTNYQVVTFGSPYAIAGERAQCMEQNAVHFQNALDIVPRLPLPIRSLYRHLGTIVRRFPSGNLCTRKAALVPRWVILLKAMIVVVVMAIAFGSQAWWIPNALVRKVFESLARNHGIESGYNPDLWWNS